MRGGLLLVVLALFACGEPTPYVDVRLRFPAGVTLDASKLLIESDDTGSPSIRPKLVRDTAAQIKSESGGFDVHFGTGIGPTRYVYLTALYDTNGNGKKDSGDYQGTLTPAPFAARDRGLFKGNENRAPDVVMTPVP